MLIIRLNGIIKKSPVKSVINKTSRKMKPETRQCQNCKKDFTIESEDFGFYERMEVNPPELCIECGMSRTMALRNERTIYWRNCDKCKTKTLSLYHPNSSFVVYCHDCWWSDQWDGLDFGTEYNPSRPLLEQINELQRKVPREAVIIVNSTNCDFGNNVRDSKNCYFSFQVSHAENIFYSTWIISKDCMDSHKITDCELTLYSVNLTNCYHSAYLQDSISCSDCYFSYDLRGCNYCLFCSNLRNKSYCINNQQLSREEYLEESKKIFDGSYKNLQNSIKKYEEIKQKAIRKFAFFIRSTDCVGNYLENSNRNFWSFEGVENQDVRYVASILHSKNTYWGYGIGVQPTENIFCSAVIKGGSMIKNSFNLLNASFCDWCDSLVSSNNCIACVGLKKKEYCILNKQYTKEEYKKIKEVLKQKGELAQFMSPAFSVFAYNETAANDHFPLEKTEVLHRGYRWQDDSFLTTGQETMKSENLPDNIKDVNEEILKEIFACVKCRRNYRIIQDELRYLKQFSLPLPRECPQCRMFARRAMHLPYRLWHRSCSCEEKSHNHDGKCLNEFETSYAPDRPEKVYCESCYNKEVY